MSLRRKRSGYVRSAKVHVSDGMSPLGDATRRAIFERLAEGPCPVGELARKLPVTRPAVSQHLKVLSDAVLPRKTGTAIVKD